MKNILFATAAAFLAYSVTQKSLTQSQAKAVNRFPLKQYTYATYRASLITSVFLFAAIIKDTFDTTKSHFMNCFYTLAMVFTISVSVIFWFIFTMNTKYFQRKSSNINTKMVLFCIVRHGYGPLLMVLYRKIFDTVEIVYSRSVLLVVLMTIFCTCIEAIYLKERRSIYLYPFMERMGRTKIIQFMIVNAMVHVAVYLLLLSIK